MTTLETNGIGKHIKIGIIEVTEHVSFDQIIKVKADISIEKINLTALKGTRFYNWLGHSIHETCLSLIIKRYLNI